MYFFNNPFTDPSDPWYYVIGILFLLLVFSALGVYIFFMGKKKKNNAEQMSDDDKKNNNDAETANDRIIETENEDQKPGDAADNT